MKSKKRRKSWEPEDVDNLKRFARRKIGTPRIAKRMKRTEAAIRQKAFSLGLSLETRVGASV